MTYLMAYAPRCYWLFGSANCRWPRQRSRSDFEQDRALALPEVFRERNGARKKREETAMKEIANQLCEALMYAQVVDSQYQFSTEWLGKSRSYLGTIKSLDGPDISHEAATTLVAALDKWLGQQDGEAKNPRLVHALSEGRAALEALRERLQ
jgi:hypothetical protein